VSTRLVVGKDVRVAIYARVSTLDQDPDSQLLALRTYCEGARHWPEEESHFPRAWVIVGEYVDRGVSGGVTSRPELNRLLADCRRRAVDVVLVWKFDRLARSTIHLLEVLRELAQLGIDFVSMTEAIDTSTSVGKMVYTFLGAIAEFERDLIRERTRAGMARARAGGKRIGRPVAGCDMERVRFLRSSEGGRLSLRKIAKLLSTTGNPISAAVLSRRLSHGVVKG